MISLFIKKEKYKIGIDGRPLTEKRAGIGNYTYEIIKNLNEIMRKEPDELEKAQIAEKNGNHTAPINYYKQAQLRELEADKFELSTKKKEEPKESAWAKIGKAIGEGAKSIATQTAESFAKSAAEELIRNAAK